MAKLIVRFMTTALELAAVLFLIGGGFVGLVYPLREGSQDIFLAIFTVPLGVAGGFIIAAIVLGIPLLVLRMNQNLEEINESLKRMSPQMIDSKQSVPQDIAPFN